MLFFQNRNALLKIEVKKKTFLNALNFLTIKMFGMTMFIQ